MKKLNLDELKVISFLTDIRGGMKQPSDSQACVTALCVPTPAKGGTGVVDKDGFDTPAY